MRRLINRDPTPRRPGRLRLFFRRLRRLGHVARWAVAALAGAGVVLGVWYSGVLRVPATNLAERVIEISARAGLTYRDLVVTGRVHTPVATLHEAIGFRAEAPLLGISPAEVKARLGALPWVAEATVGRRFPGTLFVTLRERTPFALWQEGGRFRVIDRAGHVITDTDVQSFGRLPLVVGKGAAEGAATLLDKIAQHAELQARVAAAVRVGERRWNLRLHSGADLLLPEGAEEAAIERAAEMHARHGLLDRAFASLDLRLPDRLVLRPLPDASEGEGERTGASAGAGGGRATPASAPRGAAPQHQPARPPARRPI
ncbi:MAG: cell division protein FtsQ/DivIB [Alphaproteobacteria bacterium]|nr:cell division protein FtsQ/DivIB [Alphaproteobacteria bacterium]